MKTRDILITVTRTLTGWHVYNDHQFGRITACDPQAGYEITVNLPDSDTIRIVRTQYELVEDNTVLDTADMGEEQALDELARLLSSPMSRTDRLMRLKDKFDRTAEWCRNTLGDEQEAKDVEDMAEHYMHVCESCNKYSGHDPVSVFEGWLLGEELGTQTTCACAIRANGAFLPTRNSDGSAMRSRRTCRMRAIWTTTACSTAPGVRPWIAATRCLMRANTAYPACSSHSTTRPYGRRYAPDLTC